MLFLAPVYAQYYFDSYDKSNQNSELFLDDHHPSDSADGSAIFQSFNATINGTLRSASFYLRKVNNPTGNAHAVIYAHTGTYGSTSEPTGAALATSDNFDVSTLGVGLSLINFTFSGANQINLTAGTYYVVAYENPAAGNIDGANYISAGRDTTQSHSGNYGYYANGAWGNSSTIDTIFAVEAEVEPTNDACDSDATFNRNVDGWVNVSVSDLNLVADLNTVTIQVNTTGDAENFTLRWTQATNTFTEVSDPDNICTLNTANSTRVNLNATQDRICFLFNMTGGTSGDCDVTVTTIDDFGYSNTDTYLVEFEFSYYSWDTIVYDWIDSAFEMFGVFDFMTNTVAYVTALGAWFATSLTRIVSIVTQQFRIVAEIYTWTMRWVTRFFDTILTMGGIITGLLNNTGAVVLAWGNTWTYFNIAGWYEIIPLIAIILWIDSIASRGETQGEINVFFGDMQTFTNILSYFFTLFNFVASTVIDIVFRLFDAIP